MHQLKPLNTFLYIKNNIKKFLPQIIAVLLGVFLVFFVCILGGGIKYGIKDNVELPREKISLAFINDSKLEGGKFYEEMSKDKDVEKIIYSYGYRSISTKLLAQYASSDVYYTAVQDTEYIMKEFNFELIKGKIPNSKNELLISSNFAKSNNLKLGDSYGTDINPKHGLNGTYKIAGIYKGNCTITFCYKDSVSNIKNSSDYRLMVFPKANKVNKVNAKIESFRNIDYYDLNQVKKFLDGMFKMFDIFAVIVLAITVFVITFTIGNINYMHLYDRLEEFSILDALGYSKKSIVFKLVRELALIIFIGFVLGISLGMLGGFLFNTIYCDPKGVPVGILNPWYILISFLVPVFVSLLSAIPILSFLRKMNTIEVLEGRF
jgi:ABC-type antimicrobial peptide transport system permease subunit